MRYRILLIACTAGLASVAPAQSAQFRQVFTSDSIIPASAQTSPDGKWIVLGRSEGTLASSLWMVPAAGGPPIRLTSSGYNDAQPAWFASNDRIVFMSTRPNRNGGRQQYGMTLEIDPATGNAKGAPRQVTSEAVIGRIFPSQDGRSLLYITPGEPATLKIVPTNGGNARLMAQGTHPMGGITFSPDGRYIYYSQQAGVDGNRCREAQCQTHTITRVAVDDGASTRIATASHPIQVLPVNPQYIWHRLTSAPAVWELRDAAGQPLGRMEFPEGVAPSAYTGDGYGYVGISRQRDRSVRVVAVEGGPIRMVTTADRRWPEAWMADGSAIITDRMENGRIVIEVTSLDGKPLAHYTLPETAQTSGWLSSVGPWFSYQTGSTGLSALNVVTGETKRISDEAASGIGGRGGMDQDNSRWAYTEVRGHQTTLKSTDPATGATTTLRTLTNGSTLRRYFVANGTRLAWLEARGDSLDLMVSENASGPVRKVMSARGALNGADESLAWSWKGDRLALCSGATGMERTVTILTIPASSGGAVSRQDIPLSSATACWAPQWLPGDSGLLFLVIMDRPDDPPDLAHLPLRPGAQLTVLTRDDPHEIWNFITSPDGRYAVYPVDLPVSRASIHVASFKDLIAGKR